MMLKMRLAVSWASSSMALGSVACMLLTTAGKYRDDSVGSVVGKLHIDPEVFRLQVCYDSLQRVAVLA